MIKLVLNVIFILKRQTAAVQVSRQDGTKPVTELPEAVTERKGLLRLLNHATELRQLKNEVSKLTDAKAETAGNFSQEVPLSQLSSLLRKEVANYSGHATVKVDSSGRPQVHQVAPSTSQIQSRKVHNETLTARQEIVNNFASLVESARTAALAATTAEEKEQILVNLAAQALEERKKLKALGVTFAPPKNFSKSSKAQKDTEKQQALGQTQVQHASQGKSFPGVHHLQHTSTSYQRQTSQQFSHTSMSVGSAPPPGDGIFHRCPPASGSVGGFQYDPGYPCVDQVQGEHMCGPGTGNLASSTWVELDKRYSYLQVAPLNASSINTSASTNEINACAHDCETTTGCAAFSIEVSGCYLWTKLALPAGGGTMVNRSDVMGYTCYKVGDWANENLPAIEKHACVAGEGVKPDSFEGRVCVILTRLIDQCARLSPQCKVVDKATGATDDAIYGLNQLVDTVVAAAAQAKNPHDVKNSEAVYTAINKVIKEISRAVLIGEEEGGVKVNGPCMKCNGDAPALPGSHHGAHPGIGTMHEHDLPSVEMPPNFPKTMDPAYAHWISDVGISGSAYLQLKPLDRLKIAAKLENDVSNFEAWKFSFEHPGEEPPDYVTIHNIHNEISVSNHHTTHHTEVHAHHTHVEGEHHVHHHHGGTHHHTYNEGDPRQHSLKAQCEDVALGVCMVVTSTKDAATAAQDLCLHKLNAMAQDQIIAYGHQPDQADLTKLETKNEMACTAAESALTMHHLSNVEETPAKIEHLLAEYCSSLSAALTEESVIEPTPEHTCFPEDATVLAKRVNGEQRVALKDVLPGDWVAVGSMKSGQVFFSQVLTELHTEEEHERENVQYLMLQHHRGALNITGNHFVATEARGFVPAEEVKVGEKILVSSEDNDHLISSEVVSRKWVSKKGMYAPLTWEGCVIVDGTLASSYITPPAGWMSKKAFERFTTAIGGWDGLHSVEHLLMLPVRMAHRFGLVSGLAHLAAWGLPGAAFAVRFFSANTLNLVESKGAWGVPGYIDFTGKLAGGLLEALF